MAAQVDALAPCPPGTFRPSTPIVHGTGLVLPFSDAGIHHSWVVHPASKRPAEATHAPAPSHRSRPESAPGAATSSTLGNTAPGTAAAAAAETAMPDPASHNLSADVPSKNAPRPFAPQDCTPDGQSLQSTPSTCQDGDVKPPPPLQQGPSLKRRRELSDVDGTDTGSRGRKKRRLRRFLITSRLSQPFSLPASHILNRESLATGDKRFLKLAAIMNARRIVPVVAPSASVSAAASPHLPGHISLPVPVHHPASMSTLLHRAAVANRLRKRLYEEVAATGRPIETKGVPAQLMASARFSAVSNSGSGDAARAAAVHPAAAGAGAASLQPPRAPVGLRSAAARTGLAAVGLVPAPIAMRISPRLRPVADLTPVPSLCLFKGKEVNHSPNAHDFHHDTHHNAEHDDDSDGESERYDYGASDDQEDVYADFSVLFGGGSDDEWDEEGIDDIMDELDGIAHLPKQSIS